MTLVHARLLRYCVITILRLARQFLHDRSSITFSFRSRLDFLSSRRYDQRRYRPSINHRIARDNPFVSCMFFSYDTNTHVHLAIESFVYSSGRKQVLLMRKLVQHTVYLLLEEQQPCSCLSSSRLPTRENKHRHLLLHLWPP